MPTASRNRFLQAVGIESISTGGGQCQPPVEMKVIYTPRADPKFSKSLFKLTPPGCPIFRRAHRRTALLLSSSASALPRVEVSSPAVTGAGATRVRRVRLRAAAAARRRRRDECGRRGGVEAALGGGGSRGGRGVGVVTRGGGGLAAGGEGEGEREGEGQGPVGRLPSWAGPPVAIVLFFYFLFFLFDVYDV